jgi:hypothetical protein
MDISNKRDTGKFTDYLKNIPIPEESPLISDELRNKIESLAKEEITNLSLLIGNIELNWLSSEDNRLGVTIFSGDHNELYRKKRLNLPLGKIKINLHPVLMDDEKLYNHTLVHEILHASGMIEHSEKHDNLTNQIAPAPSLSESIVLRYLQAVMISTTNVLSWECISCNHIWTRNTIIKPKKCPKCNSLLR